MNRKLVAVGLASLLALGVAGCGKDEAAEDPRLESLSPVARNAFGAVITESEPLRITTAQGTDASMMGQTQQEEADLSEPVQVVEVDGDGDIHQVFSGVAPGDTASDPVESWQNADELVFKVSDSYSDRMNEARDALGGGGVQSELIDSLAELMQPGEFRVDLDKVADADGVGDQLTTQLAGNDINAMFSQLAKQFEDAEPVDGDDNTRQIEVAFGDMQGAGLAEKMMDSLFGGADLPVDKSVMTNFVDDMMASPMDITITLDGEGRVEQTESIIDMTDAIKSLMTAVFAEAGEELPQEQIDAFLDGMEMQVIQLTAIEYDDSIKVEIPSGVSEDRTEAFVAFGQALEAGGAGSDAPDASDSGNDSSAVNTAAA